MKNNLQADELHYYVVVIKKKQYQKTIKEIVALYGNDIFVYKNSDGKPFLKNSNINISISHSEGILVVILSLGIIGVDVEKHFSISGMDAISLLKKEECELIKDLDSNEFKKVFFELWCLKESYFKAFGLFLNISDIYKKELNTTADVTYCNIYIPKYTCIILHERNIKRLVNYSHEVSNGFII